MKKKLCSLLLLMIFFVTNFSFTSVMAVSEDFNPYKKIILATDSDYNCYKSVNEKNFCGGGGYAAFYDVDFGDLGASKIKIGYGWSGATKGPITVRLYDGDPDGVKKPDTSGWIHDAETGKINLGEVIAELPKGQTSSGYSTETVSEEIPLTRTITGKHSIYVMSQANVINAYSIQFISADPKVVNAPIYEEDFNDALDTSVWATTKTAGSLDGTYSRTGTGYKFPGNSRNIVFSTDEKTKNKVYEVWMYYAKNNPENKQFMVTGTNASGNSVTKGMAAHSGYSNFRVADMTSTLPKTEGWHKFVVDCTSDKKTDFYIDGIKLVSLTDANYVFTDVTSVKLEDGSSSAVWFDDFKIYDTYSDVPSSKSEVIESVLFDSEKEVQGATEITKYDGNINISYAVTMSDVSASNFALYKKDASATDSTYTLVENGVTVSEDSTVKKSIISLPSLESTTKYRLYMNGLKCINGSVMDNDFIEFTTGNVNAREGILYTEDFNDEVGEGWTSTKFSLNSIKAHSLPSSYRSTNAGSALIYDTTNYPNSIYDIWFYYTKDTYEHKEIRLKDADGNWISIVAHSSSPGYLLKNNGSITYTSVTRDEGWHRAIIDCVDPNAVKFYVDNKLVGTLDAPFDAVSTLQLENGVNSTNIWYDDLKIYDSMTYAPAWTDEVIKSVTFDNGTNVENTDGVGAYDGDINIEYASEMSNVTAANFALYKKAANSTTDADYTLVTDGFTLTNEGTTKSVIAVNNLEAATKYRLAFTGLLTAGGNAMADDFVEFTTSDNINLLRGVTQSISFDNGITIPTKGIPAEMCGDLTVTFNETMNEDTLTKSNIVLEKVTADAIDTIAYTATVSESSYVIDAESMNLEPSSTYRLTFKTDILTQGRNYLVADEVYEFSTSSNAIKQEPAVTDDFETVSGDWTINQTAVGNANSGSYALSLNNTECATYTDYAIPNGVYEVWFYDTMSSNDSILLQLDGENEEKVLFGIKDGVADKYWLTGDILVGNRSEGWHRFIVDFTNPVKVGYYIDDTLVAERNEEFDKVTGISICNFVSSTAMLADDFAIWNLMDYQVISKVQDNNAFICDENYNTVIDYTAGDEVYIALEVDNQQEKSQNAVLLVGEYKGEVLQRVIPGTSDEIDPTESVVLKASYTIPENFDEYELKAFCWESILTMKPLMPASNPRDMKVVFLGSDDSYIEGVSAYLTEAYGDVEIVNSAVEGKGSDFGAKYFDAYAGSNDPDILFVDYAAVDTNGAEVPVKKHMEQIVQNALGLAKKPKIVFINSAGNEWHNEVAEYYNIPVIDLSQTQDYETIIGDALKTSVSVKEEAFNAETVSVDTNIMSFNICVGGSTTNEWDNRKEAVIKLLNDSDADVISMQEVSPSQYEYIAENIDEKYEVIHYIREDANTQAEGLAIAYNTEMFELVAKDRFWLSETPDVPSLGWDAAYYRICVNALLKQKTTGELLDVYDVHLDHAGSKARENGLKMIVERATKKGYNTAVMGDFNFQPTATDSYNAIANDMTDCMVNATTTESGGTFHNFGLQTNEKPIDYIFVSNENMTPLTFDIVTEQFTNTAGELKYYSDHYPVKSTVKVTYEID